MGLTIERVNIDRTTVKARVRKDAGIWFCIPDEMFIVTLYQGTDEGIDELIKKAFKATEAWKHGEQCECEIDGIKIVIRPEALKNAIKNEPGTLVTYKKYEYKVMDRKGETVVYNTILKRYVSEKSATWYACINLAKQATENPPIEPETENETNEKL